MEIQCAHNVLSDPEQRAKYDVNYEVCGRNSVRENGWVERLETGLLAITAAGVDRLFNLGGPPRTGPQLLKPGENPADAGESAA